MVRQFLSTPTTGFEKDTSRAETLDANARHKGDGERDQVALVDTPIKVAANKRARAGGQRPPRPEVLEAIETDYDHPYAHYAVGHDGRDRRRLHKQASRRGARARGREV